MYEGVLRRVLWGDGRDEILHMLEVNGISGSEADGIYQRALAERIAAIRNVHWKRVRSGTLLVALGFALLAGIWHLTEGFQVFNLLTIVLPVAPLALGVWKFLDGLVGVLTAVSRTGPVADID